MLKTPHALLIWVSVIFSLRESSSRQEFGVKTRFVQSVASSSVNNSSNDFAIQLQFRQITRIENHDRISNLIWHPVVCLSSVIVCQFGNFVLSKYCNIKDFVNWQEVRFKCHFFLLQLKQMKIPSPPYIFNRLLRESLDHASSILYFGNVLDRRI